MESASKRAFLPVASTPSTAEHYGDKFGIPQDVQNALQNVGRKGRMNVTQGRTFERTQTMPSFQTFDAPDLTWANGSTSFITDSEAISRAQAAIQKEDARRRELQPYSKTLDETSPRIRGSSPALGDELYFHSDGIDEDSMEWEGEDTMEGEARGQRRHSKKRRAVADPEDDGDETEVDDDEREPGDENSLAQDHGPTGTRASLPTASMSNIDDFPPVFSSPEISQPELFTRHPSSDKLRHPGLRDEPAGRPTRGMPRMLGKTMSAPVGQLGRFGAAKLGGGSGAKAQGMQVDETEDGFDVSEWAASEEF